MASAVAIAKEVVRRRLGKDKVLSRDQERVIKAVIGEKKDVMLVLPTGSGKSLPFQIMSETIKELHAKGEQYPANPIVLVVCPLVSLMASHKLELQKLAVPSIVLGEDKDGTLAGKYPVVMGCPEAWVGNETWKSMLLSSVYQERVVALVADEAHCIPKWGIDRDKTLKVFRDAYARLGEIRSLVPPGTPVLAMTATATKDTVKSVQRSLGMEKCLLIQRIPDRTNIHLSVSKVSVDVSSTFPPLIEKLRVEKSHMDKTLVYCKTIKECAVLYELFSLALGEDGYIDRTLPTTSENRLFGMYHRATRDTNKTVVMNSLMTRASGAARVIFATSALGMGVNIPDVRHVVNFGPSSDVESYIQESGRAGRDGVPATAQLLFHSYHLAGANKELKAYMLNTEECRRKVILGHFPGEFDAPSELHQCCDICAAKCECGDCIDLRISFQTKAPTVDRGQAVRTVDDDDIDALKDAMEELNTMYSCQLPSLFVPAEVFTGITPGLIATVIDHASYISSMNYVCEHLAVPNMRLASDIVEIFKEIFEDFEYIAPSLLPFIDLCELDIDFGDYVCCDEDWAHCV